MPRRTESDVTADAVFEALADQSRRYILEALAQRGTVTQSEIAEELPVTRQAVAKHLAVLEESGLVTSRRVGRELQFRTTPEPLASAVDWITRVGSEWDDRLAKLRRYLQR